jgi:hypothetical protein
MSSKHGKMFLSKGEEQVFSEKTFFMFFDIAEKAFFISVT